ncbi:hypothetical protein ACO2Q4_23425 [Paracoccus sp. KR1-242]
MAATGRSCHFFTGNYGPCSVFLIFGPVVEYPCGTKVLASSAQPKARAIAGQYLGNRADYGSTFAKNYGGLSFNNMNRPWKLASNKPWWLGGLMIGNTYRGRIALPHTHRSCSAKGGRF